MYLLLKIAIKAPKAKIIEQVENFSNWKNWYPPMQDTSVGMIEKGENEALLKDSSGRQIILIKDKSTEYRRTRRFTQFLFLLALLPAMLENISRLDL